MGRQNIHTHWVKGRQSSLTLHSPCRCGDLYRLSTLHVGN